jgi:hypothetical protein
MVDVLDHCGATNATMKTASTLNASVDHPEGAAIRRQVSMLGKLRDTVI